MFLTDRLCLRAFRDDDIPKIQALETEPKVRSGINLGYTLPPKPSYGEEVKRAVENSFCYTVVEQREDGAFIGVAGFKAKVDGNRSVEIFIIPTPEYWYKGYSREIGRALLEHAFVELGMHRVWVGGIASEGSPFVKLYKSLGFVEEGRLREHVWKGGKYVDYVYMGLLAQEWQEAKDAEEEKAAEEKKTAD